MGKRKFPADASLDQLVDLGVDVGRRDELPRALVAGILLRSYAFRGARGGDEPDCLGCRHHFAAAA